MNTKEQPNWLCEYELSIQHIRVYQIWAQKIENQYVFFKLIC